MAMGRHGGSSATAPPRCTKPPPAGEEPGFSHGRGAGGEIRQLVCTCGIRQMSQVHGTPRLPPVSLSCPAKRHMSFTDAAMGARLDLQVVAV